jgi:hypothetical protein
VELQVTQDQQIYSTWCSGCQPVMITHINTSIWTFHSQFQPIKTRPCTSCITFPDCCCCTDHSQLKSRSVEVDIFHTLWNRHIPAFNVFYAMKYVISKINLTFFTPTFITLFNIAVTQPVLHTENGLWCREQQSVPIKSTACTRSTATHQYDICLSKYTFHSNN